MNQMKVGQLLPLAGDITRMKILKLKLKMAL